MQLTTARLLIRPYQPSDAQALHQAVQASLTSVGRWLPWCTEDYSLDTALDWIRQCQRAYALGSAYDLAVVLRDTGRLCGSVAINQIDSAAGVGNIGYWISQPWQSQGLASEAVRAIIDLGLHTLALKRLEIITAPDNLASQRVALRVGARAEGVELRPLGPDQPATPAWVSAIGAPR